MQGNPLGQPMRPIEILIALLVMAVWGGNFVAMRIGMIHFPPFMTLSCRMLIASVILVWFLKSPKGQWPLLLAISFSMSTLHFGLALVGMQGINAGIGAIAMQASVPFAAIIVWLIYREKLGWRRFVGLIISFIGILIISGSPDITGHIHLLGVLILSAFFFAVASILIRRLKDIDFVSINAWVSILSLPQAVAISAWLERQHFEDALTAPWETWLVVVYMALGATIIGQGLWYRLLARHETNSVMPFTLLVPVFGVFFGILFLGETFDLQNISGGLVTIAGVGIILRYKTIQRSPYL